MPLGPARLEDKRLLPLILGILGSYTAGNYVQSCSLQSRSTTLPTLAANAPLPKRARTCAASARGSGHGVLSARSRAAG